MKDLKELRENIESIDKEMAELFEKRMNLSKEVASFKHENNLPTEDLKREKELLNKNSSYISNPEIKNYYEFYEKNVFELSKAIQNDSINSMTNNDSSKVISVHTNNPYDIIIKKGILTEVEKYLNLDRKVMIITDSNIQNEYIEKVLSKSKEGYVYKIKSGESSKSFSNYNKIMKKLIDYNFERSDAIIALGGGVVGDLSGFVASTYLRGIDFYNIPTTLLSMVDSSIGGKTAIDFMGYKNNIGSFYDPKRVLIDINVLKTLDKRELYSGLVESIKMSLTFSSELFYLIKENELNDILEDVIYKSLMIKKCVIEKDKFEHNLRSTLNFGHTIGHAIESYYKGKYLHGECIANGMLYFVSDRVKKELLSLLNRYNLPLNITLNKKEIMKYISHDKKSSNGTIKTIWVNEIGSFTTKELHLSEIEELLWIP